jgi:hypothetical protein
MSTNCESDEFYTRMSLKDVEGQLHREITKLPFSNCNANQEVYNYDDFKQEVIDKGNTIDRNHQMTFDQISDTFGDIIKKEINKEDVVAFKITNEIILLVAREIQNSTALISITKEETKTSKVLLDKINGSDRFKGLSDKVEVSNVLIQMLKDDIFSEIKNVSNPQMLGILMAFFISDSLINQYRAIFVDDFQNGYTYSTIIAEINIGKLGNTNLTYIENNKELISKLFGVEPNKLGISTYEIIIGSNGEIRIVKTLFYFLFVHNENLGDEKILLAMIHTKITYFLASNNKTLEDEFRWILCKHTYNLIKNIANVPPPWFINCVSVNPDLKWLTKLEEKNINIKKHENEVSLQETKVREDQTTLNTLISNDSGNVAEINKATEKLKHSTDFLKTRRDNLEQSKIEPFKLSSIIKNNPGKTALIGTGLVATGVTLALALGGKQTKKPNRKHKKRATQRKSLIKKFTKKHKKNKKRRRLRTIKKR